MCNGVTMHNDRLLAPKGFGEVVLASYCRSIFLRSTFSPFLFLFFYCLSVSTSTLFISFASLGLSIYFFSPFSSPYFCLSLYFYYFSPFLSFHPPLSPSSQFPFPFVLYFYHLFSRQFNPAAIKLLSLLVRCKTNFPLPRSGTSSTL